jgi:predicted ATP-dependent serine protease
MDNETSFDRKYNKFWEYKADALLNDTISFSELNKLVNNKLNPSGINGIDTILGGIPLGKVVFVMGKLSFGKSRMVKRIAYTLSEKYPVLYYSCGYPLKKVLESFIVHFPNKSLELAKPKNILQRILCKRNKQKGVTNERLLYFNGNYYYDINNFKIDCEREIKAKGIKVVVINSFDNLGRNKFGVEKGKVDEQIMEVLKKLSKDFYISVIVTSELKFDFKVNDILLQYPISSIPGSWAIEKYADYILFMLEDAVGEMEVVIGKGDGDNIGMRFIID